MWASASNLLIRVGPPINVVDVFEYGVDTAWDVAVRVWCKSDWLMLLLEIGGAYFQKVWEDHEPLGCLHLILQPFLSGTTLLFCFMSITNEAALLCLSFPP